MERLPQQLELFGGTARFPRRPYCTDNLADGLRIRSLPHAMRRRYIQVNPPHLRFWMLFDLDRPGAALAWDDALLPEPAWSATNPANGHAHIAYGLSAPVLVSDAARQAPLRYLAAVESAYRVALDADPGYSGLITKNPAHAHWRVLRGRQVCYELGELAEWVDLPKFLPKRGVKPENIGLGRNCDTFEHLRQLAYREVRGWKEARTAGVFVQWLNHLYYRAQDYTANEHPSPLDYRECHAIAKSVAKWVWYRFDIEDSDRRFSELQAHRGSIGGKASGASRRAASEDKQASARIMAAKGCTQAEIAKALGVTTRTIRNWALDEKAEMKP